MVPNSCLLKLGDLFAHYINTNKHGLSYKDKIIYFTNTYIINTVTKLFSGKHIQGDIHVLFFQLT